MFLPHALPIEFQTVGDLPPSCSLLHTPPIHTGPLAAVDQLDMPPCLPRGHQVGQLPPNPRHCRRREPGCPGLGEEGWQLRIKLSRHTPATPHPGHLGSTRFSRGRRVACLTCFLEVGGLRDGFSPGCTARLLCHHGRLPALCKPLFPHLSLGWTPSAPV